MPEKTILSESLYRSPILYGPGTQTLARGDDCTVFKMENETGEGIMTRYPVLPGIELLYNDIHMTIAHEEQNKAICEDVMEINHCREGRFECEFAGVSTVISPKTVDMGRDVRLCLSAGEKDDRLLYDQGGHTDTGLWNPSGVQYL